MPQKEALRFAPTGIAGLPTKLSTSRHVGRKFASDGGTSCAARRPAIEKYLRARRGQLRAGGPARLGSPEFATPDRERFGLAELQSFLPGRAVDTEEPHDRIESA